MSKYFTDFEMRCRCGLMICSAKPMKKNFMRKLDALREEWGKVLNPKSGRRCIEHNKAVGGVAFSQHLVGNACDFFFEDPEELAAFVMLAEKFDFKGIGFGRGKVHIDDRAELARWAY